MRTGATFSPCRHYRYALWREWDASKPTVVFCGLNPSTADETEDDPTIRRELGYAREWGFGRYVKVNAYALRSTDPRALWKASNPCGDDNLGHIIVHAKAAQLFVAAWGNNIRPAQETAILTAMVVSRVQVHALKLTKQGHPSHPLYLPKTLWPFDWETRKPFQPYTVVARPQSPGAEHELPPGGRAPTREVPPRGDATRGEP